MGGTGGRTHSHDDRAGPRPEEAEQRAPAHVATGLLGLQQAAGNAAVVSLLSEPAECAECRRPLSPAPLAVHRDGGDDRDGFRDIFNMRPDEARLDAQEDYDDAVAEKNAWIDQGIRGPKDVRAPTGIGGFGVQYDPLFNELTITLSGGVTFTDGLVIDGSGTVTANQPPVAPRPPSRRSWPSRSSSGRPSWRRGSGRPIRRGRPASSPASR